MFRKAGVQYRSLLDAIQTQSKMPDADVIRHSGMFCKIKYRKRSSDMKKIVWKQM